MHKLGMAVLVAALASTTAWAQKSTFDKDGANKPADQGAPGVVTGNRGDGGIALKSDSVQANANVPAVSGGVSVNARDNMRAATPPHNVKMVFALTTGNYVSDVQVKVTNQSGKVVIDDIANGPWLFAQLPAGTYNATATYNGKPVTHRFSVGKSGVKTAQFRWPASVEAAGTGAAASDAGGQILGTGPQEPQPQPPR